MELRSFSDAQQYLESLISQKGYLTVGGGLHRITALLDSLDNPQKKIKTVHVGGTAGKGSTSTILAKILETAGYKTGLFLSPHITAVNERIQINGEQITDEDYLRLTKQIKPLIDSQQKDLKSTYFEAQVALMFLYFAEQQVDIAVIEVGMGGKFDATNVVKPLVSVLTNVGLDHQQFLGDTVEEIAQEKVGIFKPNTPVVTGVTQPGVKDIVKEKAKETNSPVTFISSDNFSIFRSNEKGSIFDCFKPTLKDVHLSLLGQFQVKNAVLAINAIEKVKEQGFNVSEEQIRDALAHVHVVGRMDVVQTDPTIIFDSAHNPMKLQALVESLNTLFPDKKISFVFAAKNDKRVGEMIEILEPIAKKFYFTQFDATTDFGKNMGLSLEELAKNTAVTYTLYNIAADAYHTAVKDLKNDDVLCVTGSMYLVGELYTLAKV